MAQFLELTHLLGLVVARCHDCVVVVDAEHSVGGHVVGGVKDVCVPFDVAGAFPLVNVNTGRARKHDVGFEHIHACECTVAFADELGGDMLVLFAQSWIVGGSRQIDRFLTAFFKFVANGLEYVPVALAVGENGKGHVVALGLFLLSEAENEAQLHDGIAQEIGSRAEYADEYGKKHASRAGVNVDEVEIRNHFFTLL